MWVNLMRFVVPILSLVGLSFAFLWAWFNDQLHAVPMSGNASGFSSAMPFLLTTMLALQCGLLFLLSRSRKTTNTDVLVGTTTEALNVAPSSEQVNTEWVLDALAGGLLLLIPRELLLT
jgi:hypothetical protein